MANVLKTLQNLRGGKEDWKVCENLRNVLC